MPIEITVAMRNTTLEYIDLTLSEFDCQVHALHSNSGMKTFRKILEF